MLFTRFNSDRVIPVVKGLPMGLAIVVVSASVALADLSPSTQALFDAVRGKDIDGARSAVLAGADIRARNDKGLSPLEFAIEQGAFDVARYLEAVRRDRGTDDPFAPDAVPMGAFHPEIVLPSETPTTYQIPTPTVVAEAPPPVLSKPPASVTSSKPPATTMPKVEPPAKRPAVVQTPAPAPRTTLPTAEKVEAAEVVAETPAPVASPEMKAADADAVATAPVPTPAAETDSPTSAESPSLFSRIGQWFGIGGESAAASTPSEPAAEPVAVAPEPTPVAPPEVAEVDVPPVAAAAAPAEPVVETQELARMSEPLVPSKSSEGAAESGRVVSIWGGSGSSGTTAPSEPAGAAPAQPEGHGRSAAGTASATEMARATPPSAPTSSVVLMDRETATAALFDAVARDDVRGVENAILSGADIMARNGDGLTATRVAINAGKFDVLKVLLRVRNIADTRLPRSLTEPVPTGAGSKRP